MREILFRGKRADNGEWVEGNLFIPDRADIPTQICVGTNIVRITYDIIPESIGEFTSLTDKNGTKIFEGDIVKEEYEVFVSARAKEKRVKIGYVEYESNSLCCGYYAYFWNDKKKWRGNFAIHCGCEVIGNIHDNPELLKEREGNV